MGRRGAESAERRLAKTETEIESAMEASSAVSSPLGPDLCALRASAANLVLHGAVRAPIGTCSSPDRRAEPWSDGGARRHGAQEREVDASQLDRRVPELARGLDVVRRAIRA